MSHLDCNTPEGRKYIKSQNETANMIGRLLHLDVYQTDDTTAADIDGHLFKDGERVGIIEIKSRNMSAAMLMIDYGGTYLITYDKLLKGQKLSKQYQVPYALIVRGLFDNSIYLWKLTDSTGKFLFPFETAATWTKETCNGGSIKRVNAFLPVKNSVKMA
jgi:hypothetical protein